MILFVTSAWMHHGMVGGAFLDALVEECCELEWFESQIKGIFERKRHLSNKLVAATMVRRVTPDPNVSGECKLCEVNTSLSGTAGTVLR